ncbi:MAG TPA: hypothetical protein PLS35_17295, partial [Nitrospira sp.]|nr:hypothetical protein [Nitrospira sp.]
AMQIGVELSHSEASMVFCDAGGTHAFPPDKLVSACFALTRPFSVAGSVVSRSEHLYSRPVRGSFHPDSSLTVMIFSCPAPDLAPEYRC